MNKKEFIEELCKKLRLAPADEAEKTVNYYAEAIDDRIEDGMTEEEAVAAIGNIDDIVREVIGDAEVRENEGTWDSDDKSVRKNYVVDPEGVTAVNAAETSGDIELARSTDGKIHVRVTENKFVSYSVTKSAGTVTVAKKTQRGGFRLNLGILTISGDGIFSHASGIRLELPDTIAPNITVKTGSGDIRGTVTAAQSLACGSGSGDISLSSVAAGRTELSTASGDVDGVDITTNDLSVSTASGDIELKRVAAIGLKLKSVSGEISGKEIYSDDKLIVNTVSGDVDIEMASPLKVGTVESTSGDITLLLYGRDEDYSVSVRSISGKVSAPGNNEEAQNAVRVRTASGDIDVSCEV